MLAALSACVGRPAFDFSPGVHDVAAPPVASARSQDVAEWIKKEAWTLDDLTALADRLHPDLRVAWLDVEAAKKIGLVNWRS